MASSSPVSSSISACESTNLLATTSEAIQQEIKQSSTTGAFRKAISDPETYNAENISFLDEYFHSLRMNFPDLMEFLKTLLLGSHSDGYSEDINDEDDVNTISDKKVAISTIISFLQIYFNSIYKITVNSRSICIIFKLYMNLITYCT